jgi:cytoskeletal protein RodZ
MSHSKNRNPQEPEALKDLEPEEENLEQASTSEVNIGSLLRNERKRKGLSYSEISEITCLRTNSLKALENEDWANLPSPVFVTGFIRSYGRALGLDEGELVSLYQKTVPHVAPLPKPLVEPVRSKKPLYVLFVILLLTMAVAYYLWKEYPTRQEILTSPKAITPAGNEIEKPKIPKDLLAGTESISSETKDETTLMPQADLKTTGGEAGEVQVEEKKEKTILPPQTDLKTTDGETQDVLAEEKKDKTILPPQADLKTTGGEAREVQVEEKKEETTLPPQADLKTTDGETQDVLAEEKKEKEHIRSSIKKSAQPKYGIMPPIEDRPLTLTAHFRERTWIKIYVDDGDPKEYIFNPGNRHEWKARKGFDLIIGNADGIDLEFNGEKIENLGAPGQVVRLVFPQYYIERSQN